MLQQIKSDLQKLADAERAKNLSRYFKTGKGEYGEGDVFLGIPVPEQRRIAKRYSDSTLKDLQKLLSSKIHEHRLTALLILVIQYQRADETRKEKIFSFYIKNLKHVNNWDLVDLSAHKIAGAHMLNKDKSVLYELVRSNNVWKRRIAVLSTFQFIKHGQFKDSLRIAELLLNDSHDLIHKAVGWMLREIGKQNQEAEEQFLLKHDTKMPRTMLRYAVERFDNNKRQFYLKK
jgi:3-methyladenine DNA glycosylase AlkD